MTERFRLDPERVAVAAGPSLAAELGLPRRPVHVEVGFGKDVRLLREARQDPGSLYLGIDVSRKKVRSLCRKVARAGLGNVRALCGDVRDVLRDMLPPRCVLDFTALFPDPWPKRRHRKHRWITPETAALLARALVPGGGVVVATDDPDYELQIRASLRSASLTLESDTARIPDEDRTLFAERFERRGVRVRYQRWRLIRV